MVSPRHVRFPAAVDEALEAHTRRTGATRSGVISVAVAEWLRLQGHPRVRFVEPVPGERRAALVDGPEIWSVAEAWLQHRAPDRSVSLVAEATGLRPDQVEAALAYWADNREEIDALVARIQAEQEAAFSAWERRRELDHVR
ncbi:MAG: hypothetical protein LBC97_05335 [Bifidobacteriaceae bacterium]|nr:hypothetical protein [Bifidobacteriaceae bacterium]